MNWIKTNTGYQIATKTGLVTISMMGIKIEKNALPNRKN